MSPSIIPSRLFTYVWLTTLIVLAIYVRVQGTGAYYYSEDEMLHIWLAKSKSIKQLLTFSLYETHPPLGHILRYYWLQISDNIIFSRSLSLLFGITAILLYYFTGKKLGGELAGMCAATLAAFSYGSIIESFVARNYSIFIFFATTSLYYYVTWRDSRSNRHLALYASFAVLACLTHFSAILAIFAVASYETLTGYFQKQSPKQQITWAILNLTIAAIATLVYLVWDYNGIVLGAPYFTIPSAYKYALITLGTPILASIYVLPSLYILPVLAFLVFLPCVRQDKKLREFAPLCYIALVTGTLLVAINHYYPAGTRHGIWVMPFIIVTAGWVLANGATELNRLITERTHLPATSLVATLILFAGFCVCDAEQRFQQEPNEYQIKTQDWQSLTSHLRTLDTHSVIITARDDASLIQNIYPHLRTLAFANTQAAIAVPYANTHFIVHPYERRIETPQILLATLTEAEKRGMLESIDKLVFMRTVWNAYAKDREPLARLFTCKSLEKQIISFPPKAPSDDEEKLAPVMLITVSKADFFKQVIAQDGKAHDCIR